MRISINGKAQSAFWKLGAVALMVATLALFFTACNQTGGGGEKPTPTPTPKHAINFSVDSTTPNGTLKAEGDGITQPATSPINVEEGKTVTFTATANDGYRVKGWTLDGNAVNGTAETYTLAVTQPATVKVSFEAIPPTKYTVTLTQTEGGTVTASPAIPQDKLMLKDTEITFTAEANAGYKIGKWTVTGSTLEAGTGADGSQTAKVKITADTTVKVSFEVTPVEGGAVLILSPDKLNIEVTAKTADGSAITVEGCTVATLASGTTTTLTATGTRVVLKGEIIELDCSINQLTALNVQGLTYLQMIDCGSNQLTELNVEGCTSLKGLGCGDNKLTSLNLRGLTSLQTLFCGSNQLTSLNVQDLTALQRLYCPANQLNAQAMTKLLNALPVRKASDDARAVLYTEETDKTEGNCKDFTQSEDLKKAFDGAKSRNWKLQKIDASESNVDL